MLSLACVDFSVNPMPRNKSSSVKVPIFNGTNYAFSSRRIETYLSSLGYDVSMSIKNGYTIPPTPTNPNTKREYEYNAKAENSILSGLPDTEFVKVMHCTTTKETWDNMQRIYEEDVKVKEAKL